MTGPIDTSIRIAPLIKKCCRLSLQHSRAVNLLAYALEERYGIHPSELNIDEFIDAVDYGQGKITVRRLDKLMKDEGHPARKGRGV